MQQQTSVSYHQTSISVGYHRHLSVYDIVVTLNGLGTKYIVACRTDSYSYIYKIRLAFETNYYYACELHIFPVCHNGCCGYPVPYKKMLEYIQTSSTNVGTS